MRGGRTEKVREKDPRKEGKMNHERNVNEKEESIQNLRET